MKPRFVLLLTRDGNFQALLAQALSDSGTIILVAHNMNDALQLICSRGAELDLAVIDFGDGCHGMTLLTAIQAVRPHLAVVVVTSNDAYHAAAVAYANGVEACLAKPISAMELKIVIDELPTPKLQLAAA